METLRLTKGTTGKLIGLGVVLILVLVLGLFAACTATRQQPSSETSTSTPELTLHNGCNDTSGDTATTEVYTSGINDYSCCNGNSRAYGTTMVLLVLPGPPRAAGPAGVVTGITNFSSPSSQTVLQMAAGATASPFVIQNTTGTPVFSVGTNGDVFALSSLEVGHSITITSNAVTSDTSLLVSAANGNLTLNSSSGVVYLGEYNSLIVPDTVVGKNIFATNDMGAPNGLFGTLSITGTLYVDNIDAINPGDTMNIGATNAGTINIGNAPTGTTVNIATDATAPDTINIGDPTDTLTILGTTSEQVRQP